ncbi:MAG: ParB/RepB/Spo0J family partition protein [Nitrososphaerales archaeon]
MVTQIPLNLIEWNPYNSRVEYSDSSIRRLHNSLKNHGQLVTIKVRACPKHNGKYELVYGHRRFLAAKRLNWKTIRAEIIEADEDRMATESLIENFERDELSDFEKALTFQRLNKDFHKSYEQIGNLLGISRQHVSNYVSMLNLFSFDYLSSRPGLTESVHKLTEHHARILSRVNDNDARADLVIRTMKEKLSVRDLSRIIGRLRSWFRSNAKPRITEEPFDDDSSTEALEREKISSLIVNKLRLIHSGDFKSLESMQIFDERFSLYSAFPPFDKVEKDYAMSKVRNWSYEIAPKLACKISDFKVDLFGDMALSTLTVSYSGLLQGRELKMRAGGTIISIKRDGEWKIRHEHWSRLSGNYPDILQNRQTSRKIVSQI